MSEYKGEYKETAAYLIPKEDLALMKEDRGLKEYIVKHLSSELAERIMGILEREEEIIIRQSDLRVSEVMPINSVEYRRQINWSPLVRCKECRYSHERYAQEDSWLECLNPMWDDDQKACYPTIEKDGYCKWGIRRENA